MCYIQSFLHLIPGLFVVEQLQLKMYLNLTAYMYPQYVLVLLTTTHTETKKYITAMWLRKE